MTDMTAIDAYGTLTQPETLTISRLLPGPIDRVWDYLTRDELRAQWLAAGEMELNPGAKFELVWRNDRLSPHPGQRPDGFAEEERMRSTIVEIAAPRHLTITWDDTGEVSFDLAARGDKVLLTVTHRRLARRSTLLGVSAGWHTHLDVLASIIDGSQPPSFWDEWTRLRGEYAERLPA